MNTKNLFFTLIISLTYFFSASAQKETLFYAFYEGQVYFLLEFKKRTLEIYDPYEEKDRNFEWSWGPSQITNPTSPKSPRNHRNPNNSYQLNLKKISLFQPNNKQIWIPIETIEEIKAKANKIERISRSGLSNYKIESLPKVEIRDTNVRQKRIYYKFARLLQTNNEFTNQLYSTFLPKIKMDALQEFKEENEKKEEKLFIEEQLKIEQDYENKELIKSRFDALELEFTEEDSPIQKLNRDATVYSPVA